MSSQQTNLHIATLQREPMVVNDLQVLVQAGNQFGCIYADPPWQYNRSPRGVASRHYATMSMDELLALPVKKLSSDQAHLHLWTTHSFMREGFQLMEAWGFQYKSMFVWVKHQLGTGYYWRGAAEYLMLGVKGSCPFREHRHRNWMLADRTKHSAKPFHVRSLLERVSPGPYLELFGREAIQGWTIFGDQVPVQNRALSISGGSLLFDES